MILINRLFDDVFTNYDRAFFNEDHSYWRRDTHVRSREHEDSYEYYVPLAGFKKEDIKVTIKGDEALVQAKKDENTATYSFLIPEDGDLSRLSANHEDGLLTVKIEKAEKAKAIEVKIK